MENYLSIVNISICAHIRRFLVFFFIRFHYLLVFY